MSKQSTFAHGQTFPCSGTVTKEVVILTALLSLTLFMPFIHTYFEVIAYIISIMQIHQLALMTQYRATYCMPIWSAASSQQLCGQTGGRGRLCAKKAQHGLTSTAPLQDRLQLRLGQMQLCCLHRKLKLPHQCFTCLHKSAFRQPILKWLFTYNLQVIPS